MIRTPRSVTVTPVPGPAGGAPDPFQVVPQILDLVRLHGAIFFRADFREPWAYTSPRTLDIEGVLPPGPGSLVMFHIIAAGECWVSLDGEVRHPLRAGDIIVMPYGDAHAFGSTQAADQVSIQELLPPLPWTSFPSIDHGGDGASTLVVCGYVRGDGVLFDPILRALPPVFVVTPPPGPAAAFMQASVEYAMAAARGMPSPTSWTDRRLPELLFTEVLRLYLLEAADASLTGWLQALRDPLVGHALALLHADPARPWTVAALADAVASSRSALVERFVRMLGRPPIRYLTEWRLGLASGLLRSTTMSVAEVAEAVGYGSEAAFSRAFKRARGRSPAHWRTDRFEDG